jgi:hypothetical protein
MGTMTKPEMVAVIMAMDSELNDFADLCSAQAQNIRTLEALVRVLERQLGDVVAALDRDEQGELFHAEKMKMN